MAEPRRILVTGAGGFVGVALCRTLTAEGCHVIAGLRRETDLEDAAECRVLGDLGGDGALDAALEGVDAVVHLAARTHVITDRAADPMEAYRRINVDGTRRLAEAAIAAGVGRLIFLSSVKVNGEATHGTPFGETDPPAPEDAYGASKWEAEQILAELSGEGGLETVVLRAPLVYGPGVKANFLSLMKLCDSQLPLPLGGLTDNRRSLVYLGNLTDALRASLVHPEAAGRTYLVSDGEDVSTAELARRIRGALDRPARLLPVPASALCAALAVAGRRAAADRLTGSLAIDSGLIRRELGWSPPYSLDQGLQATVRWYRGGGR